jgi:hypothetical protein
MGYEMRCLRSKLLFVEGTEQRALEAIQSLVGQETCVGGGQEPHFMFINSSDDFATAPTLWDALIAWRWLPLWDDQQDRLGEFNFTGQTYGDEDLLFQTLAPYVRADSYILMAGEDGVIWRWFFSEGRVQKKLRVPRPIRRHCSCSRASIKRVAARLVATLGQRRSGGWPGSPAVDSSRSLRPRAR